MLSQDLMGLGVHPSDGAAGDCSCWEFAAITCKEEHIHCAHSQDSEENHGQGSPVPFRAPSHTHQQPQGQQWDRTELPSGAAAFCLINISVQN